MSRQPWAEQQRQHARVNRQNAATPNLDAARAERSAGPTLVVETLEQRLVRLLPGAWLSEALTGSERWKVHREGRSVSGPSKREAVDRAIALWAGR